MDNLLDLVINKVIEGVNVLFDQPSDFEESRKKLILVLDCFDRAGELSWILQQYLVRRILGVGYSVHLIRLRCGNHPIARLLRPMSAGGLHRVRLDLQQTEL